jgi:predicted nucleic acid-binding protein
MNKLIEISIPYTPIEKITIISDLPDNKFLEVAKESSADYLITGNFKDFNFETFENTKIVSPKYYFENFKW